jgi:hypothetical protein
MIGPGNGETSKARRMGNAELEGQVSSKGRGRPLGTRRFLYGGPVSETCRRHHSLVFCGLTHQWRNYNKALGSRMAVALSG